MAVITMGESVVHAVSKVKENGQVTGQAHNECVLAGGRPAFHGEMIFKCEAGIGRDHRA
jgi:hypothetical protein